MSETDNKNVRNVSLVDTMERLRMERFPHISRETVLELLRLHAEPATNKQSLIRSIDEMISERTEG